MYKMRLTVAGNGVFRSRRKRPFGVSELGRPEEGLDGFIGWARVT